MACDDSNERITSNSGALCLMQTGTTLTIHAVLDDYRGGCRSERESGCEVSSNAEAIVVTSRSVTVDTSDDGNSCTDEHTSITASCELTAPPDGMHTIRYGDQEATILLPLAEQASLFGDRDACFEGGYEP
jgi:hypothetical protein